MTFAWSRAAQHLRTLAASLSLDPSQQASVRWIADRIASHGLVLADEVGTGKTRIACALVRAVIRAGGRVAVVVPRGLMHQWELEMRALDAAAPPPKRLSTLPQFAADARGAAELHPAATPEWWLVSHGLRTPIVKSGADLFRIALPALTRAALEPEAARDARTALGKFVRRFQAREDGAVWMEVALLAATRLKDDTAFRARLEAMPLPRPGGDEPVVACFQGRAEPDARLLTERILGAWLGDFDLLVIDEAHKGRDGGEGSEPAKVIARLINNILRQPRHGRRLGMTATPMELGLQQWVELLHRCRTGPPDDELVRVVSAFEQAMRAARGAPDESARIEALIEAAASFQCALAPYVTRRRRAALPEMRAYTEAVGDGGRVHPHRNVEAVRVDWSDEHVVTPAWREALFAAECMSAAARGSGASLGAIGSLYTRLAAGHISADALHPDEEAATVPANPKMRRVFYWRKRFREARQRAATGHGVSAEMAHPRVLGAIREVENWLEEGEKVLVFGVYTTPQEQLERALNVRDAMRRLDRGDIVSNDVGHADSSLAFHFERMRAECRFSGALRHVSGPEAVRSLWEDANKRYANERRGVYERLERLVAGKTRPELRDLGGDSAFEAALCSHVACLVMDERLAGRQSAGAGPKDLRRVFADFWHTRLGWYRGDSDDDEFDTARLRRDLLLRDNAPVSRPCRRMSGTTEYPTRRHLQEAFNRPHAAPHVLIAQSQVGREGLDFHRACRVVLQLHAEWNPGVLEQQIGRVDRKGGRWAELAEAWMRERQGPPPRIEVRRLVFPGTYDDRQWAIVGARQAHFDGSLFGSMLPAEVLEGLEPEHRRRLLAAAPDFSPTVEPTGDSVSTPPLR